MNLALELQNISKKYIEYVEWINIFHGLCHRYELGKPGDDVFELVFSELEKRLQEEKTNDHITQTGTKRD